ncbi:MAG: DUF1648 domain-containing protein [Planctomycetota bacterium]|nr:MAG: DUF1648 domain-containing protein [Planctomycetota bacterium]
MNARNLGFAALLFVSALGVVDLALELPHMPDPAATHFGLDGEPNGWSSPASLALGQGITVGSVLLILGGLAFLLPRLPLALLNVPHKDYWFAPERRQDSFRFVQAWMAWFGALTQLFLLAVFHSIHRYNRLGGEDGLAFGWLPLAGYFLGLGVALFLLFARFGRPPAERFAGRR